MLRVPGAVDGGVGQAPVWRMPRAHRTLARAALYDLRDPDGSRALRRRRLLRACADSPPHFSRARAITGYHSLDDEDEPVPSMIRRHKYGLDQSLGRALAECLGERIPFVGEDYDLVVPVPLHPARLRWRGFNQAALLADAVAQRLARPIRCTTLTRVVATQPQTSQDRRQRRLNVRAAFAVKRPELVVNRRVLLVDDVMTTGATADECSRTLLRAGARRVDVFTLARVV